MWVAGLVVVAGCSGSNVDLAEVTGTVTFQGLPAAAEVKFNPIDNRGRPAGRSSSGYADEDGEFRLQFSADEFGALPGRHRVLIRIFRPGSGAGGEASITPVKSVALERDVSEEGSHFVFAITM